jgi:hypothetical protein
MIDRRETIELREEAQMLRVQRWADAPWGRLFVSLSHCSRWLNRLSIGMDFSSPDEANKNIIF